MSHIYPRTKNLCWRPNQVAPAFVSYSLFIHGFAKDLMYDLFTASNGEVLTRTWQPRPYFCKIAEGPQSGIGRPHPREGPGSSPCDSMPDGLLY